MNAKSILENGLGVLGIELGSTRIKGVIVDSDGKVIASGGFEWNNRLENGLWTYHQDEILTGISACYQDLKKNVQEEYGVVLKKFKAIGISAMMHGYIALDDDLNFLASFRTWRNMNTEKAAGILSKAFNFNVPLRYSIAHLYQCILEEDAHVADIRYLSTLAGYMHLLLSDQKVLGIDDASGMFPIDTETGTYDAGMVEIFDNMIAEKNYPWKLTDILPKVMKAGENAGCLTKFGALLLDPSGDLEEGIPMCPPEGDAGTGMVATNSVRQRSGNISVGTSVFTMIVMEKALQKVYPAIDVVMTPDGSPVAMIHSNNGTSDLDDWMRIFKEYNALMGIEMSNGELYEKMMNLAMTGDPNAGGIVSYNYYAGESLTEVELGNPLLVRRSTDHFTLANLMKSTLYTIFGAVKVGQNAIDEEGIRLDLLTGHGGLFKTKEVAQRIVAACYNTPVRVLATAGEGGAWGIALLALYLAEGTDVSLPDFLDKRIFADADASIIAPTPEDVEGFNGFMKNYEEALPVQRAAGYTLLKD